MARKDGRSTSRRNNSRSSKKRPKSTPRASSRASSSRAPYKRGDPTKALKKYYDTNKKFKPAPYAPMTYTSRSPRVREVRHYRAGSNGKYATLASAPGDYGVSIT